VLSETRRLAVIVTTSDTNRLIEIAEESRSAAQSGAVVRLFFRDESIPALCQPEVAGRILPEGLFDREAIVRVQGAFEHLATSGDVRLYACSSSLYVWGVTSPELVSAVTGVRGLIAFLAEDLACADEVRTY